MLLAPPSRESVGHHAWAYERAACVSDLMSRHPRTCRRQGSTGAWWYEDVVASGGALGAHVSPEGAAAERPPDFAGSAALFVRGNGLPTPPRRDNTDGAVRHRSASPSQADTDSLQRVTSGASMLSRTPSRGGPMTSSPRRLRSGLCKGELRDGGRDTPPTRGRAVRTPDLFQNHTFTTNTAQDLVEAGVHKFAPASVGLACRLRNYAITSVAVFASYEGDVDGMTQAEVRVCFTVSPLPCV